jgi:tRNA A37 threonylcarbamoyladenosine synthetase subunit TsaC/SUA5/YrdC
MQTKQKTVGIRVPDCEVVKALCTGIEQPLVTTSAVTPEGRALIGADEIRDEFGHGLELILDGGTHPLEPSTVLSLIGDEVQVLRQGQGDASDVLGQT